MSATKSRRWIIIPFVGLLVIALTPASCASSDGNVNRPASSFKIIGSNTVTPLTSVWAEEFMAAHPDVSIAVSGPGSGAGIAALINGTTDVCQASRKIKTQEIDQAKTNDIEPYEIQVATDALSVVVHPSNPVSELTITQLSAIYSSKITNWL